MSNFKLCEEEMNKLKARVERLVAENAELRDELENANLALADKEQELKEALNDFDFTPGQKWRMQMKIDEAEKEARIYRDLWIKEREKSESLLKLYVKTRRLAMAKS